MSTDAMAAAESFLQELRAGEEQITQINNRMNLVRAKVDELRSRGEQGRQVIEQSVSELKSHVESRSTDVHGRFDALEEQLRALGVLIREAVEAFAAEQEMTRQQQTTYVDAVDQGRVEIERRQQRLVEDNEAFKSFSEQTAADLRSEDQEAARVYHTEVIQTADTRRSALDQQSRAKEEMLRQQLETQLAERLARFEEHVRQVSSRVRDSLDSSESQINETMQQQIESFSQEDRSRRERMSSESRSLANALQGLGSQLDELTTTVVKGSDDVQSLMSATTVGVRTAIEAFESVIRLMDDIIDAAR
jgi:uncharacterized phage infection (PIP) family protein YhgE